MCLMMYYCCSQFFGIRMPYDHFVQTFPVKRKQSHNSIINMKKLLLILMLCMSYGAALAQTVSGRVTSMLDGEPLPGASVVIKGTTNGTVTDIDGRYQL